MLFALFSLAITVVIAYLFKRRRWPFLLVVSTFATYGVLLLMMPYPIAPDVFYGTLLIGTIAIPFVFGASLLVLRPMRKKPSQ